VRSSNCREVLLFFCPTRIRKWKYKIGHHVCLSALVRGKRIPGHNCQVLQGAGWRKTKIIQGASGSYITIPQYRFN